MSPASRSFKSRTGPSAAQQESSSNNNINNNNPNTGYNVVDPSSLGPPTITSDANLTGSGTRHLNHNPQGSGSNEGRPHGFSSTPFVSRDHFPGQLHIHTQCQGHPTTSAVNPYWPEYQQPSQSSTLPPNHHVSSTQHTASAVPQDNRTSTKSAPTPPEPQRMGPPPSRPNQNQVHAQTHPWRIKVYNACLACRKKKIKCDGQPTCQRCTRLGFECSYIEVPPQAKNAKPKKPSAAEASVSAQASGSSSTADNAPGQTTKKSMASTHSQTNVVETAKEIRQQRRPSTKDAASGSFPHASSRRNREPPSGKDLFGEKSLGPTGSTSSQAPRPELRPGDTPGQLVSKPMTTFVMDRDALLPDLYHILVNSVTIPNMAKQTSPSTARPGGVLVGMDQLRLALASPILPVFTVSDADMTDPEQQHSSFQKDPSTSSLLDQSTPLGFVITNKSVIQYLVHVYFECFHPHWMIVDKEKFLGQLRDRSSPPDSLLLVAICAAGAKYSDHEGLCADPGNLATIGDQFLTHARILLQDRFDMPTMSTLQALLILYWCQVQTGRASLRFMYVGMAIRMAQEMGLNRPLDTKRLKEMDEREVQIRKTIWWSCYQADRWTSAVLGKPMVISDVDCLVDYPSSLNESDRYNIQLFRHMTDLAKILGKVILNLYTSTNAATCSSAIFSHLDQSLTTWIESLPTILVNTDNALFTPTLQDSTGTPNTARCSSSQQRSSTSVKPAISHSNHQDPLLTESSYPESGSALLYHTVRIMLYRPFLHNSALAPALPLTLQSPLARCRESAVAISEIAENMVTDQRSYRQLFNSIHISLCAAATVHRFVIVSQYQQQSSGLGPSEDSMMTSASSTPATLSKAPMHAKTDLYFLALLLRILRNCCRFSIEKNLLGTIMEHFIPHKHLSPQDIAWAQEEVQKTLTIVPFSTRLPLLALTGSRSSVSGTAIQQTMLSTQSQQESVTLISQPAQQQSPQEPLPYHIQTQQFQQYQLGLRQHQEQQRQQQQQQLLLQQPCQQGPARHRQSSTVEILSVGSSHAPPLGTCTSSPAMADNPRQTRSSSRASSSMGSPPEYVAMMVSGAFASSSVTERLQQYQHELDALHQHHRNQQSELRQHHQQQALQLEQAQIYQQNQQQTFIAPQDQPDSSHHNPVPTQPSSDGVASPTIPSYSALSDPIVARNKRHSEVSSKRKQAKQKQHDTQYESLVQEQVEYHQHQQYHQHPGYQQRSSQQQPFFQQPVQTFPQTDSYMTNASPTDMDENLALGMAGSDELMTSTSAPSVVSQVTGATDLSGASDINSLDELLGIESTGYYSEIPSTDIGDNYTNMDSTGLSLTGSSVEGQNQGHLTGSSNNSDTIWQPQQQQRPSLTGSSSGSNTHNGQSRGSHTRRNSMSENINSNNNSSSGKSSSQGRYHEGSGTSTPGPMSMGTTWFGVDNMSPDGSNQLPPLNPPRRSESPAGYPYPYAFSYAPQQPVPYVGYSTMGRSIAFSPGPPYVYAADNSGAMGVYLPAPGPQMSHGHPANDPALGWQPHIQLAPPQVMQPQPGHVQEMYSSRMSGPIYSGSQFPQQGHAQIIHYVQVQTPVMHQPSIQLAPLQTILQDPHPQQPQHPQHPHRQQHSPTQSPQNIQLPPLPPPTQQPPMQLPSQQRPQDPQRQDQQHQQPKQNRPEQQVRHPSATLLPPLSRNVLREESGSSRSFSPTSSNSTLVNTTSVSNSSNSQRESSSSGSFGRETSSGGESTSRSTSAQLEGSSGQSRRSRSDDTSPGASNESSSTTESPNSTEDVSNSNESGSSSDNVGSRSSSADPTALTMGPIAAGTGDASASSGSGGDGSTSEENDIRAGAAGTGGSNGGGLEGGNNSGRTGGGRRRRAKKSVSPSGSGDSSTSSNSSGSVPNPQAPPGRHYRAHHPGQDGGRMAKPNDETQSTSSGTGSVGRSDAMSTGGGDTHPGRRKHKTTCPSWNLEDASNVMMDSNVRGGHISKPSGRRNQRKVSGGGSVVDGVGDSSGSDGGPPVSTSRPRADSDSAGNGSGSGSNSGTLHDSSSGKGTSSGTGSPGGNSISSGHARKGRLNRKGKSKRGKGKTNPQAQQ